jgi:diguanylate cyclase (GGDEF)-like protein
MGDDTTMTSSEQDLRAARAAVRHSATMAMASGIVVFAVVEIVASLIVAFAAPDLGRVTTAVAAGVLAGVISVPLVVVLSRSVTERRVETIAGFMAREREIKEVSRQREFTTRVSHALEMADAEADALSTTEAVLAALAPDMPTELLLADNSYAHLVRMVSSSPTGEPPDCPVGSPNECVAARRAQPMVFTDSRDFDVCPKLRQRDGGPHSAVCVPVSIVGRAVGVLHGVGSAGAAPGEDVVGGLQVLAEQIGVRVGMLRMVSESQIQASTDGMTGLLNRRTLENEVRQLQQDDTPFAVALADLDSFKSLNDRHGHAVGDRALRLFADVLRSTVRASDLVCRYGGEEFAVVLPSCTIEEAHATIERVREDLARALVDATTPAFTSSFGIAAPDPLGDFDLLVRRADELLYEAKRAGGNCVVAQGRDLDRTPSGSPSTPPEAEPAPATY